MDKQEEKMIDYVASCNEPAKLRIIVDNAIAKNALALKKAAKRRLFEILPSEESGTLGYEVWRSIFALEDALKDERGKTVLLSRTRQKIKRDGEIKCVSDLVLKSESDGFKMLRDRGMLDLAFEAVALRFPEQFDPPVIAAAQKRLDDTGYLESA